MLRSNNFYKLSAGNFYGCHVFILNCRAKEIITVKFSAKKVYCTIKDAP